MFPLLDGSNYPSWRKKLVMALTIADIDHAIETPRPMLPVLAAQDTPAAAAAAAADNPARQMSYDLEKAKWERSNKKCLMVIKGTIIPTTRDAIPECESATEYLQKIKDQFTGSTKAYAGALIKKFANAEYDVSGIREYIMKMSHMAGQLKTYEMEQKEDFVIHHILNSLPKHYKKIYIQTSLSRRTTTLRAKGSATFSKARALCMCCGKKGYHTKNCVDFLKWLNKSKIPFEEDPAKRGKKH
ncbi:hypothetical protein U9M48_038866 [Paspalum notatum var. saurae]|uniref:Uncharacterized protein n=1 Tax=Paspalum notatum var. saurae TaxID=547442 RepID=A0AAQ3UK61_PASNO